MRAMIRGALPISLVGALLALGLAVALAKGGDGRGGGESGTVRAERGTNIAVTVSPDRRTIVMDLQGVLWRMPGAGGKATRITGNLQDPALPDFSPDGRRIAFQSYAARAVRTVASRARRA
jgi:dipeptidyl aminopeptidase/acylaminoacyl peptidase